MKLPTNIKIFIGIIVIAVLIQVGSSIVGTGANLYNQSIIYAQDYDQKKQEQITSYDNYYEMFSKKSSVANINKTAFIEVTNIIMSNRKDGQSLAWKWSQENQQIPYGEFTVFYRELSGVVDLMYNAQMQLESDKQSIVNKHNTMIRQFPNNVYNRFLHIEPLKYTFGCISDSTTKHFKL